MPEHPRPPLDLDQYSFWIHFGMATMVGCTMIAMGIFLAWRVMSAREMIEKVEVSLAEHRAYISSRDAEWRPIVVHVRDQQDVIERNQAAILDAIRRLDRRP